MAAQPPICVLHIGKTGGSYLRSIIRANPGPGQTELRLLKHPGNLRSSRRHHGDTRRLAFVVRDPAWRFVSAFNSRMRQGRPTYQFDWTPEEAVAFAWFDSPDALARGLGSSDPRLHSAARFAMRAIQHLKLDYRYYFEDVETLAAERSRIAMAIDLADLNRNLDGVMARLGLADYKMPHRPVVHAAPTPAEPGSVPGSGVGTGVHLLPHSWCRSFTARRSSSPRRYRCTWPSAFPPACSGVRRPTRHSVPASARRRAG